MTDKQRTTYNTIVQEFEHYGETMPHLSILGLDENGKSVLKPIVYISQGIFRSRSDMFRALEKNGLLPNISFSYFHKLWARYMSEYQIKKFVPFAKCEVCCKFYDRYHFATDAATKVEIKNQQQGHRQAIKLDRLRLKMREDVGDVFKDSVLHMLIDGMDSHKTNIPKEGKCLSAVAMNLPLI
jgi:hypothetical protein